MKVGKKELTFLILIISTVFSCKEDAPVSLAPSSPTDLNIFWESTSSVVLTWSVVNGATSYNVYKEGSITPIASKITTYSYTDTNASENTASTNYQVSAVNEFGESVKTTLASPGALSPPAPSRLTHIRNISTTVILSWTAVIGANSYSVYRSEGTTITASTANTELIASGIADLTYIDNTVVQGKSYTYQITATNLFGESPKSEVRNTFNISTIGNTGNQPYGIAVDAAGNVYTANYGSNTVTKITSGGASSTFGTTGLRPYGILIDQYSNIYTSNKDSNTITKITPSGVSTIAWGNIGGGIAPTGITIDDDGNIYTANYGSNNISKISSSGGDGTILSITGTQPYGIVIDKNGNIYTANNGDNTVTQYIPGDNPITTKAWASTGLNPIGIAVDDDGNIYTANNGSDNVSKITPAGTATTPWGDTGVGSAPYGIAVDASGNVYTANYGNSNISKISSGTGVILSKTRNFPTAIAVDAAGNVYTANYSSNTVTKISI